MTNDMTAAAREFDDEVAPISFGGCATVGRICMHMAFGGCVYIWRDMHAYWPFFIFFQFARYPF